MSVGYDINDLIHLLFQGLIFFQCEQVGRSFHYLEQVGSDESWSLQEFLSASVLEIITCAAQIFNCKLGLFKSIRHKGLFLCLKSWAPEVVFKPYFLESHGLDVSRLTVILFCRTT